MVVNKMDGTVKQLSQDVTCVTHDLSIDLFDLKDAINDNVTEYIRVMKDIFKEEVGKNSLINNTKFQFYSIPKTSYSNITTMTWNSLKC